jgi:hypothetical protein
MRFLWVHTIIDKDGYLVPNIASIEPRGDHCWEVVPLFERQEQLDVIDWGAILQQRFELWVASILGNCEYQPADNSPIAEKVYVLSVRDKDGYYVPVIAATDEKWVPTLLEGWKEFERQIGNLDLWRPEHWFVTCVGIAQCDEAPKRQEGL